MHIHTILSNRRVSLDLFQLNEDDRAKWDWN